MPTTIQSIKEIFEDRELAETYAKARPLYPPALFQLLSSLTRQHERAWDVGTGNGQAAISVAEHYKSVVATDLSASQISHAMKRENITYSAMSATPSAEELERIVGPEGSVDLVTVATALHWFDLDKFYPIVRHLLRKPGGVFAAFTTRSGEIQVCPEFDEALKQWAATVAASRPVGPEPVMLSALPFPFDPVPGVEAGKGVERSPLVINMEKRTSFDDFILMLRSHVPVRGLGEGVDLLNEDARQALAKAWGPEKERTVIHPIQVILGTVSAKSANAN